MHPEMREYFRRRLLEERRRLAGDLRDGGGLARQALREATGELSAYDNHPADLGSETFERGKDLSRRRDLQKALADVDGALARIEEGTYGYCQRCGRPIPRERLEALPATPYCVACAEEREGGPRARLAAGRERRSA
ncbi:MAG: conjugal transfer protein TraR, partial [Bacillota bacterium]